MGGKRRKGVREEESKGKSGCAPPETKSWLRHWLFLFHEGLLTHSNSTATSDNYFFTLSIL